MPESTFFKKLQNVSQNAVRYFLNQFQSNKNGLLICFSVVLIYRIYVSRKEESRKEERHICSIKIVMAMLHTCWALIIYIYSKAVIHLLADSHCTHSQRKLSQEQPNKVSGLLFYWNEWISHNILMLMSGSSQTPAITFHTYLKITSYCHKYLWVTNLFKIN